MTTYPNDRIRTRVESRVSVATHPADRRALALLGLIPGVVAHATQQALHTALGALRANARR